MLRSLLITKPSKLPAGMRRPLERFLSRSGDEGRRDIVPVSRSLLDRIGWRQALAGLVKHQAASAGLGALRVRPLPARPGFAASTA